MLSRRIIRPVFESENLVLAYNGGEQSLKRASILKIHVQFPKYVSVYLYFRFTCSAVISPKHRKVSA